MGIYSCPSANYFEAGTFEISKYFIVLLTLYSLIEIFMIWKTISAFRSIPGLIKVPFTVIFYFCINLVFIRNILSFMGGTLICYPQLLYFIIAEYLYIFKDVLPFIMSYRIAIMLDISEIRYSFSNKLAQIILILLAIDLACYTAYFIYNAIIGFVLWNLMIFTFIGLLMLSVVFNYPMYYMIRYVKLRTKYSESYAELARWYILLLGINGYFVSRTFYIILVSIYRFNSSLGALNQETLYGSFMLVYYVLTEVFPFLSIFLVITEGLKDAMNSKQLTKHTEYNDDM